MCDAEEFGRERERTNSVLEGTDTFTLKVPGN